ncbi:MAG: prolipoprotein diacylglyceryl transferase [Verrucomicrobiota bacterium]|nr:prolipoprotein diacylglyceryl transferase [Verrucomicrobiota bacterium]
MLAYFVDNFDPFIFRLWGNVGPRWYGFAYVMAFFSAFLVVRYLSRRGYCDIAPQRVSDFITWTALCGVLLGGRLGYVLFYRPEMLRDPLSIFKVWEGGMSSHGGMFGIALFVFLYARHHKLSWRNLGDALVCGAPLGLFFGRCANFINGELYGRASNVAWAMQFPKELFENATEADRALAAAVPIVPGVNDIDQLVVAARHNPMLTDALRGILTPRHPSQLYEAFFEGIVLFSILWFVRTRCRPANGVLIGLFFICYAIFRIIIENFREPDASLIGPFTRGQFLSFFLILFGLAFFVSAKLRPIYPIRRPD